MLVRMTMTISTIIISSIVNPRSRPNPPSVASIARSGTRWEGAQAVGAEGPPLDRPASTGRQPRYPSLSGVRAGGFAPPPLDGFAVHCIRLPATRSAGDLAYQVATFDNLGIRRSVATAER